MVCGIQCYNDTNFTKRLTNLNGKTLTATSFDFPPYNYQVKDKDGNAKGWDGAEYRLTEMIGRSMNFKFELKTPTDGGLWGGKGKFLRYIILVLFQSNPSNFQTTLVTLVV